MLQHLINDPRAWRADTLDDRSRWYHPLSERVLTAVAETMTDLRKQPRPTTDINLAETPCAVCRADLQPARNDLETGRGFVILHGIPEGRYSPQELQAVYWLVGQLLGRPAAQNVQGTLLYDVKDTGQDVRYGARFSVTNAESTFHTDSSFVEEVVDYVGLLCLNKARSGGLSQVVSGWSVHNRLLAEHRDLLTILYEPFHIDRRGGLRPGDAPTIPFPVFAWDGRELHVRYLRYWIEVGQEKAGRPLTTQQRAALDGLDQVSADPQLRAEFAMEPGEMFFVNNRWILHNRTAFEDHAEPQRRRHLVRLWLRTHNSTSLTSS